MKDLEYLGERFWKKEQKIIQKKNSEIFKKLYDLFLNLSYKSGKLYK